MSAMLFWESRLKALTLRGSFQLTPHLDTYVVKIGFTQCLSVGLGYYALSLHALFILRKIFLYISTSVDVWILS